MKGPNKYSIEIVYRDRNGKIIAFDVGMSKEDVNKLLRKNPGSYRSTLIIQ